MNNRDIIVASILCIALLMTIWTSFTVIYNGSMGLDLISKPSLNSTLLFCFISYMIVVQFFYLVLSIFIVVDHLNISVSNLSSIIPKSLRVDLIVALIISNLITVFYGIIWMKSLYDYIGIKSMISSIIAMAYPLATSILETYYLATKVDI